MRIRPSQKNLSSSPKKQQQSLSITEHRKEIESTLRELHRLQSEIYELKVAQNPHSSSPVKKEIKQLSYLYENMTKPKRKNNLKVKSKDIELAMRIMNQEWSAESQLLPEIEEPPMALTSASRFSSLSKHSTQQSYQMPKEVLHNAFKNITNNDFNMGLLGDQQDESQTISTLTLYNFINYNETDNFDPIQEAYKMFIGSDGKFDFNKFNEFGQTFGMPKVKSYHTFVEAVRQACGNEEIPEEGITLQQFRKIINTRI